MEQEISGISKFPEKIKDNLKRWTEIFETNFRKISVPIFNRYFRKFWSNGTRQRANAPTRPQIQELGLQTTYQSDDGTSEYTCLRKIMALPFLPPSQIPAIFTRLQLQATTEPLQKFVEYVDST